MTKRKTISASIGVAGLALVVAVGYLAYQGVQNKGASPQSSTKAASAQKDVGVGEGGGSASIGSTPSSTPIPSGPVQLSGRLAVSAQLHSDGLGDGYTVTSGIAGGTFKQLGDYYSVYDSTGKPVDWPDSDALNISEFKAEGGSFIALTSSTAGLEGNTTQYVERLDPATGKPLWKQALTAGNSYDIGQISTKLVEIIEHVGGGPSDDAEQLSHFLDADTGTERFSLPTCDASQSAVYVTSKPSTLAASTENTTNIVLSLAPFMTVTSTGDSCGAQPGVVQQRDETTGDVTGTPSLPTVSNGVIYPSNYIGTGDSIVVATGDMVAALDSTGAELWGVQTPGSVVDADTKYVVVNVAQSQKLFVLNAETGATIQTIDTASGPYAGMTDAALIGSGWLALSTDDANATGATLVKLKSIGADQ